MCCSLDQGELIPAEADHVGYMTTCASNPNLLCLESLLIESRLYVLAKKMGEVVTGCCSLRIT